MKQERRRSARSFHQFWQQLNPAQQFSVFELQRFGYELSFVREQEQQRVAVLKAGDRLASVDAEGQINIAPTVVLRD
ncbi:hypothetical protein [Rheinheimera sp.]|uniref:hypothetical protein n=1 Tax=Rheinheimera sp. TaxID=1869214 RepID=UPI00307E3A8B